MKKILIISFFSPPSSAIGAVRITKFIKYLLRFGWDVTLVTVKEKYFENLNPETLKDINGAHVIRTEIIRPIKGLNEWGLYWLPYLKSELEKLLKKEKFDISLWTGNPFYHWILAPHFKKKYGLRYILDFRDEWSFSDIAKNWFGSKFYRFKRYLDNKIAKLMEPRIVKGSSSVINVTEELTDLYKKKYSKLIGEKCFFTIFNGIDLEEVPTFDNIKSHEYFEIIYTGKFGGFRNPITFFEAFQKFVEELNLKSNEIKITLIGKKEKNIDEYVNKLNIAEYINFIGYKPYNETLKLIKQSDIALLIVSFVTEGSTKIFDYIALNKKIFVISDFEDARAVKIAKEYGNAIFSKNNVDEIKKALKNAYFNRIDFQINPKVLEFYNREFQTKQLEYILNSVIEGRL